MTCSKKYKATIDYENNAEGFWENFDNLIDTLVHVSSMGRGECVIISEEDLEILKGIPGWNSGDIRAPHPIILEEVEDG